MKPGEVDTSAFMAMCHGLARITVTQFEPVLDYEVARVLEKAIALTPAASLAKIRNAANKATITAQPSSLYHPTTIGGLRARGRARRVHGDKLLYWLQNRYPDILWEQIDARRRKALAAKIKARGLSKKSFYDIARMLGLTVRSAGYVPKAKPKSGAIYPEDLSARRSKSVAAYGVAFENAQPTAANPHVGGKRALERAIAGRVRFFQTNLKKAVFDSTAKVARRYPGVTVR